MAFLDLISSSLDTLLKQDIRDDGQHFILLQISGSYKNAQPAKASLKEGIWFKAQTFGCLSLFFFSSGKLGLDIVFTVVFS